MPRERMVVLQGTADEGVELKIEEESLKCVLCHEEFISKIWF